MNDTLNAYMKSVVDLAEERGYVVLRLDAFGAVEVCPKNQNPDRYAIEFRGLFVLDSMRLCLRDLTEGAA